MSTFAGFKDERVQVTIFPPALKRRSEGALVAGTQRYLRAILHSRGKLILCTFHQANESYHMNSVCKHLS